jgi:hypothetical protein
MGVESKKSKLVPYTEPVEEETGLGSPFDNPKLIKEQRKAYENALSQKLEEEEKAKWAEGSRTVIVSFSKVISQERWDRIFSKKEGPEKD